MAGIRTPQPLDEMAEKWPEVYEELFKYQEQLEKYYGDMQVHVSACLRQIFVGGGRPTVVAWPFFESGRLEEAMSKVFHDAWVFCSCQVGCPEVVVLLFCCFVIEDY